MAGIGPSPFAWSVRRHSRRTRCGYYAAAEEAAPTAGAGNKLLEAALGSPLPYGGVRLGCSGRFLPQRHRLKGRVTISPRAGSTGYRRRILTVAALSENNKLLDIHSSEVGWQYPPDGKPAILALDRSLPAGAARVRIVVADSDAQRIGSCDIILGR
jgi:hypothetical protein